MKYWIDKYRLECSLVLLTLFMLSLMELCHPYFFLQDDNRSFHLPYYLHNLKAIAGGELPLFNFNQYLGTPVSFLSAPFYPINYLGMLLSRLFFGHYFAAMELIAAMHLTIAMLGFYRFSRSFGLDRPSCSFGAIAWTFSPFVITVGNSWIHILGYAAYLPWIFYFSLRQIEGFSLKVSVRLLLVRLLALLLGFPQSFLYGATFDLLLVTLLFAVREKRCSAKEFILCYLGNYLLLLVFALPVLLQLFHEAGLSYGRKNIIPWSEYAGFSYKLKEWFHGLLMPFNNSGSNLFGELDFVSHVGYLTLLFAVLAVVSRKNRFKREVYVFAVLGLFSFLWSADLFVTKVFYTIPFFNKLRYPFKLQFFTGFFLVSLAAFGLHLFLARIREKSTRGKLVVAAIIILQVFNFLVLYTVLPQRMLSNHLDAVPFSEPLKDLLTPGRIVSAGPDAILAGERAVPGNTVPTLGYNYAMLWGLYQFGGYEALLSEKNFHASLDLKNNSIFNVANGTALDFVADVPLEYLRKWGVAWYVVNKSVPLAGTDGLQLVHSDRFRNVLHDPAAYPLVYWLDNPKEGKISYAFHTDSVEMATSRSTAGILVVNVLYQPWFIASIDGAPAQVAETKDSQMAIEVPEGNHAVTLCYHDRNLTRGVLFSVCILSLLILCVIAKWLMCRTQERLR